MPFLTGYGKRKEIQYGTTLPGANLADFPKLFTIVADADIAAELSGGGGIAITEDDETTLVPFGLYPSSDPTSGDLILRAKFPSLLTAASPGDVIGYIYYDAGETTTEDKAGTVANGYIVFMPLEEDPSGSAPQMFDWVSETNVGTSAGSMTSGDLVSAVVANGIDCDGSNDNIAVSVSNGANFTLECCINSPLTGLMRDVLGFPYPSYAPSILIASTTDVRVVFGAGYKITSVGSLSANTDHHLAVTVDPGATTGFDLELYQDGASVGTAADVDQGATPNGATLNIGIGVAFATAYLGIIDEVRASSVRRDADWLAYAAEDDLNNSATFTLGTEEVDGGGGAVLPALDQGMLIGGLSTLCGGLA